GLSWMRPVQGGASLRRCATGVFCRPGGREHRRRGRRPRAARRRVSLGFQMRLAFAGTPEFARVALKALLAAGHEIVLVLTQPDRPAGRGLKLPPSPVRTEAQAAGISVLQPRGLRLDGKFPEEAAQAHESLRGANVDAMIVAAYGLILPQSVLD